MMTLTSRRGRTVAALAAALILVGSVAEARVGRGSGGGFGSRGGRTYSAPPPTSTAPSTAAPIQRSQAPQNQFQNRPGTPAGQVAQPGRFGGFGGGLMAGLLGAGLLGMLFGGGFFGGLGGIASFLGLILQIGLVVLLASFALRWFRNRQQPVPAYARSQPGQGGPVPPVGGMGGPSSGLGGLGGALGGMGLGRASGGARMQDAPVRKPGVRDEIGIGEADYAAFERSLVEVQGAYSRQDVEALWDLATPEMAGYIQEELNEATQKGVVNTATDVRLLQGDLSEAWREGNVDYATVAMRFSAIETSTEKATGRIVEGDPAKPSEVAELWTFRRDGGGSWKLSAIQQA